MSQPKRIRVLVVDDSLFMRAAIKKLLDAEPDLEVIDMAKNGQQAVDKVLSLKPDVVTMDFNMPVLNGAEAVREIMAKHPTPVLMFSAHTQKGAKETFQALHAGAVDFVTKPNGEVSAKLDDIAEELLHKLRGAAGASMRAHRAATAAPPPRQSLRAPRMMTLPPTGPRVIFIAISTGGPVALSKVIPALPATLRSAVVVVQHMPAAFTSTLAERLNRESKVHVEEATDGARLMPGTVYIAPGGKHLELDAAGLLRLTDGPLVHGCRPAADVTMKSAAHVLGRRAIGLVMTGMGKDGAAGAMAIKKAGGKTFAQDKDSSVIYGMPKAAVDIGAVDEVIPLAELATKLQSL